jgi:hypothetical protein
MDSPTCPLHCFEMAGWIFKLPKVDQLVRLLAYMLKEQD